MRRAHATSRVRDFSFLVHDIGTLKFLFMVQGSRFTDVGTFLFIVEEWSRVQPGKVHDVGTLFLFMIESLRFIMSAHSCVHPCSFDCCRGSFLSFKAHSMLQIVGNNAHIEISTAEGKHGPNAKAMAPHKQGDTGSEATIQVQIIEID
jgi:hypothetical protein